MLRTTIIVLNMLQTLTAFEVCFIRNAGRVFDLSSSLFGGLIKPRLLKLPLGAKNFK